MKNRTVLAGVLCSLTITAGSAHAGTVLQTFELFNHPSGAINPQAYGLRLDGFGGESPVTFSFEDGMGNSTVQLRVIDVGGGDLQISLQGTMTGNSATSGTDFGTFALNILYDVADVGNGWDDQNTVDGGFIGDLTAVAATAASPLMDGESQDLFSLSDGSGSFRFLEDGYRISGDSDTWVGRGWVSPDGNPGATNDFLFRGVEIVPLPAAAWAGLAMLGGLGVARRIRK